MLTPAHAHALAMALDPALILRAQAIKPDPWRKRLFLSAMRRILCSRATGKSRAASALALRAAVFQPKSLVLFLPAARKSAVHRVD